MIINVGIAFVVIWSITGFVRFFNRSTDDELPYFLSENIVSHLVEGPISWIIGIGRMLYWIMNKIESLV